MTNERGGLSGRGGGGLALTRPESWERGQLAGAGGCSHTCSECSDIRVTHYGDNIVNRNITQVIIMSSFSSSFSTQAIMVSKELIRANMQIHIKSSKTF